MTRTKLLVFLSLGALALALIPASGIAAKRTVKSKMTLSAGADLDIEVKGINLENCEEWTCILGLASSAGVKVEDILRFKIEKDGSWVAYAKKEEEEGDDDDSAEGDDDDSAEDEDAWRDKPILTEAERVAKLEEKAMKPYTVEKAKGTVIQEGEKRILRIESELLPDKTFDVRTNGYFGLHLNGAKIGSVTKTGVVRVTLD